MWLELGVRCLVGRSGCSCVPLFFNNAASVSRSKSLRQRSGRPRSANSAIISCVVSIVGLNVRPVASALSLFTCMKGIVPARTRVRNQEYPTHHFAGLTGRPGSTTTSIPSHRGCPQAATAGDVRCKFPRVAKLNWRQGSALYAPSFYKIKTPQLLPKAAANPPEKKTKAKIGQKGPTFDTKPALVPSQFARWSGGLRQFLCD